MEVVPAVAAAAGVMAVDLDMAGQFMAPTMAPDRMAPDLMVLLTALRMGLHTALDC